MYVRKMIYKNINLLYDKNRIVQEIMSCENIFFDIAPYSHWISLAKQNKIFMVETLENYESITVQDQGKLIEKKFRAPKSFYIKSPNFNDKSYAQIKKNLYRDSQWNPNIKNKLSYTKMFIENLPFDSIDLVRVFITENTFLPTHHDGIEYQDKKNIGLSIVPIHSDTPLLVYNPYFKKIESIYSSSFIFNDRYLHGIPLVNGLRIDIRIFGEFKKEFIKF
jgi:hypothetical protein